MKGLKLRAPLPPVAGLKLVKNVTTAINVTPPSISATTASVITRRTSTLAATRILDVNRESVLGVDASRRQVDHLERSAVKTLNVLPVFAIATNVEKRNHWGGAATMTSPASVESAPMVLVPNLAKASAMMALSA